MSLIKLKKGEWYFLKGIPMGSLKRVTALARFSHRNKTEAWFYMNDCIVTNQHKKYSRPHLKKEATAGLHIKHFEFKLASDYIIKKYNERLIIDTLVS